MTIDRRVYVISDLHLGGLAPTAESRGFRMMKHPGALATFIDRVREKQTAGNAVELVINGDFVDFLAHDHGGANRWTSFAYERGRALAAFEAIATGFDAPVFDALKRFVETCRLTVMLGNHDLELSLPEVREAFLRRLGDAPTRNVRFLYDGEALEVGDAVIEHGNAHDPANAVDFDALRYLRAIRTRGELDVELQKRAFRPPPGSDLVANVMNPLKERYAFIDLLKPESEALFGLLLAIEPDSRSELSKLAKLARGIVNLVPKPGFPIHLANVSASAATPSNDPDALAAFIEAGLPNEKAIGTGSGAAGVQLADVSAGSWLESKIGVARLLAAGKQSTLTTRLPALRQAFRALEDDPTWRLDVESGRRYRAAAVSLAASSGARRGYRYVVFGHTHHAKREDLDDVGAVYLNSGTWANLMKFPVLPKDDTEALATIIQFAEDVRDNNYSSDDGPSGGASHDDEGRLRQIFQPTYVRLDVRPDGKIDDGHVCPFDPKLGKLLE